MNKEQLGAAKVIYLIELNQPKHGASIYKYAAYADDGSGELQVIWPEDSDSEKKAREEGFSVQNKDGNKPKYYFARGGYGYNRALDIAIDLQRAGARCAVYTLTGFAPIRVVVPKKEGE